MIDLYFEIRKRICPFDEVVRHIPTKQKILDLGCGRGILYNYYLKNFNYIEYTGLDINKKNINKLNKSCNKNCYFKNQDLEKDKINFSEYDCILMIDVMHHLKKNFQNKIMEKILGEMKIGSTLIYKDISNRSFFKGFANRVHDLIFSMQLINYYDSEKIIDYAKNNMKISGINKYNTQNFWYDHEFLIIKK